MMISYLFTFDLPKVVFHAAAPCSSRIRRDDEGGGGFAAGEGVGGGELAGVEARVAAAQTHAEGIAGLPTHDIVGAGDVAVAAHRLGVEACELVQVAGQTQGGFDVEV